MWRITLMQILFFARLIAGEAELPSSTKATMEALTKTSDKLALEHNKGLIEARAKAIVGLSKALETETKKANLEGAIAIKRKIQELEKLNDENTDLLGSAKGPSAPATSINATLFATGCNNLEVRVNGIRMLNANRDEVTNTQLIIKVGDVIAVRNGDRHDVNSNFIMATTSDGIPLFWTTRAWTSYLPPDVKAWTDLTDKKFITKPVELAGTREYTDLIERNASTIPGHRKEMGAISGVLMAEDKATYICYRVTAQDMIPKPMK